MFECQNCFGCRRYGRDKPGSLPHACWAVTAVIHKCRRRGCISQPSPNTDPVLHEETWLTLLECARYARGFFVEELEALTEKLTASCQGAVHTQTPALNFGLMELEAVLQC